MVTPRLARVSAARQEFFERVSRLGHVLTTGFLLVAIVYRSVGAGLFFRHRNRPWAASVRRFKRRQGVPDTNASWEREAILLVWQVIQAPPP
jgi:hypothetical protein